VLRIPGVVNIVGIEGPEPISEEELEALKTVSKSRRACDAHAYLNEGAWVQVVRGPLTGIRGQFIRKAGQDCIVLRVQILHQAAAVHIDASEVVGVC